jgi:hypothetical protein
VGEKIMSTIKSCLDCKNLDLKNNHNKCKHTGDCSPSDYKYFEPKLNNVCSSFSCEKCDCHKWFIHIIDGIKKYECRKCYRVFEPSKEVINIENQTICAWDECNKECGIIQGHADGTYFCSHDCFVKYEKKYYYCSFCNDHILVVDSFDYIRKDGKGFCNPSCQNKYKEKIEAEKNAELLKRMERISNEELLKAAEKICSSSTVEMKNCIGCKAEFAQSNVEPCKSCINDSNYETKGKSYLEFMKQFGAEPVNSWAEEYLINPGEPTRDFNGLKTGGKFVKDTRGWKQVVSPYFFEEASYKGNDIKMATTYYDYYGRSAQVVYGDGSKDNIHVKIREEPEEEKVEPEEEKVEPEKVKSELDELLVKAQDIKKKIRERIGELEEKFNKLHDIMNKIKYNSNEHKVMYKGYEFHINWQGHLLMDGSGLEDDIYVEIGELIYSKIYKQFVKYLDKNAKLLNVKLPADRSKGKFCSNCGSKTISKVKYVKQLKKKYKEDLKHLEDEYDSSIEIYKSSLTSKHNNTITDLKKTFEQSTKDMIKKHNEEKVSIENQYMHEINLYRQKIKYLEAEFGQRYDHNIGMFKSGFTVCCDRCGTYYSSDRPCPRCGQRHF